MEDPQTTPNEYILMLINLARDIDYLISPPNKPEHPLGQTDEVLSVDQQSDS